MDLDIFGRSATDKVSSQKNVTMLPQITCASALPGKTGNTKIAFFTRCIRALPEFNQSLLDFFNLDFFSLFDLRLIVTLLSDSLNLVINVFSYGLLGGGAWFRRKEVESAAAVGHELHAQTTSVLSSGFPHLQGNAEAVE